MRILALGLGGAGCRIAARLYETDRRSSKVACVEALAVDIDGATIAQLGALPDRSKIYFPSVEPGLSRDSGDGAQTAIVDIGEISSRIQNMDLSETDALFICCGLGGSMVDVAPPVIAALRATTTEPIFGLVTLPRLSEGGKRSAKAADDIEMLSPLLDGVILFDNETWSQRMPPHQETPAKTGLKGGGIFGLKKKQKKEMSPQDYQQMKLNEGIVRRVSLILRAGEFKADGGIDLAEVVMDSGEVLNTIKGMGFITIGYAVQPLSPPHPLSFLLRLRPAGLFSDKSNKSASRIVELAKQAIYQEISTPCDITSAAKALILIAGPSHELSLKGFMTVRKWIDRSIAGLETRSGDYPVTNTKYVAIIIMLSGLENIPRLTELKEIREQYNAGLRQVPSEEMRSLPEAATALHTPVAGGTGADGSALPTKLQKKDEMLVLPGKKVRADVMDRDRPKKTGEPPVLYPDRERHAGKEIPGISLKPREQPGKSPADDAVEKTAPAGKPDVPVSPVSPITPQGPGVTVDSARQEPPHPMKHRVIISPEQGTSRRESAAHRLPRTSIPAASKAGTGDEQTAPDSHGGGMEESARMMSDRLKSRELDRQRIEKELQRQRMIAIGGRRQKQEPAGAPSGLPSPVAEEPKKIVRRQSRTEPEPTTPGPGEVSAKPAELPPPEERTIIRIKKRATPKEEGGAAQTGETVPDPGSGTGLDIVNHPAEYQVEKKAEVAKIGLKDLIRQARDDILKGKLVLKKDAPQVKDDALLHTELKMKKSKSPIDYGSSKEQPSRAPPRRDTAPPGKRKEQPEPDDDDEL
jgi:cell division GTPase FtsZ